MAYSFLTLAKDVLEKENIPLSIEEMWETAKVDSVKIFSQIVFQPLGSR